MPSTHTSSILRGRRRLLALAGASVAGPWLAGCAAPMTGTPPATSTVSAAAPTAARPAPLRSGQGFRFQVTNLFNGESVGMASYRVNESSGGLTRLDVELPASNVHPSQDAPRRGPCTLLDAAHLRDEFHIEGDLHFRDPEAWLPANPTRAQQHRNAWRQGNDPAWRRWDTRLTTQGWQQVRVPAGDYVALAVTREIWFDHPENWRSHNMRLERLWHVPALGFWVRRELSGRYLVPGDRPDWFEEDRILLELA